MKKTAALTLVLVALTSLPAAAFDGGRGIHIALTDKLDAPHVAAADHNNAAAKVAAADERAAARVAAAGVKPAAAKVAAAAAKPAAARVTAAIVAEGGNALIAMAFADKSPSSIYLK